MGFGSEVESTEDSDEDDRCSLLVVLGFPIASIEVCINDVMNGKWLLLVPRFNVKIAPLSFNFRTLILSLRDRLEITPRKA